MDLGECCFFLDMYMKGKNCFMYVPAVSTKPLTAFFADAYAPSPKTTVSAASEVRMTIDPLLMFLGADAVFLPGTTMGWGSCCSMARTTARTQRKEPTPWDSLSRRHSSSDVSLMGCCALAPIYKPIYPLPLG